VARHPTVRRQGGGAIVNTASVSGTAGDYGLSSYNAAKAGVINLTRSAAPSPAATSDREGTAVGLSFSGGLGLAGLLAR